MKRYLIILCLFLATGGIQELRAGSAFMSKGGLREGRAGQQAVNDSLLQVLEDEISRSELYIIRRKERIDSLRSIRPMTDALRLQIAQEYQHFQADSSREWYLQLENADEPVRSEAHVGLVNLLAASGRYGNAIQVMQQEGAPAIRGSKSFKTVWLLYKELAEDTQIPMFQEDANTLAMQYYDSMMVAYAAEKDSIYESALWYELYCACDRGDIEQALEYSRKLLATVTPEEHLYAILAYGHAVLHKQAGDTDKRNEWLIRSAITDVLCGITDNGSSWLVAQDCYDAGNLKTAYAISNYSLNNATIFNAPTRYIQIFTPGHMIASKYEYEQHRASMRLLILLVLLGIALVVVVGGALYSLAQNRKLKALNKQLTELNVRLQAANKVKEQYICRYLEVYSDYIRRLTTMARRAGEKDPAGFMDHEMENFYRSFDDTFLSLYGTFVQDFNALLKPEARLTPKPGERMTIEMRIFALILLGITSSAKIAELLCYSPNTISNYRVKIKNGALGDRDTFEQRVQQIGGNEI